ncbi:hypothetical protein VTN77DRAFT_7218 [Rasamsonia byssochlamydoides]|uniref:uncharacterized protein n=1 Tax=Rasamsonia byssochlamydoides TaxID=89139 RepID=UPI0037423BF2
MHLLRDQMLINPASLTSAVVCLASISTAACSSDSQSPIRGIPSCAQSCVEAFIISEYPSNSCCGLADIDCLCRTNTTSGLTLGEAALSCFVSFCSLDPLAGSNVYEICNSVSGALPETHSTITATFLGTVSAPFIATSSMPTSTSNVVYSTPSASKTTLIASTSSTRPVTTSQSSFSTSIVRPTWTTSIMSSTSQSTHSSSPSPSATQSAFSLSTPAVVGVSVSSGVSAVFLAGVLLFFCVRKARQRSANAEKETFEIGGSMTEPPNFAPLSSRSPPPNPGQSPGENAVRPNFHNFPLEPVTRSGPLVVVTKPPAGQAPRSDETIGIAISPETERDGSPQSQSSQRTLSQLLPDKPDYALYPEPLRLSRQGPRPESGGTVFEEDGERPRSIFGPPLEVARNQPIRADNLSGQQVRRKGDPNRRPYPGLPPDPRALMYAAERIQNQKPSMKDSVRSGGQEVQLPIQQNKSSDANGGRDRYPVLAPSGDWPVQGSQLSRDRNRRSFGRGLSRIGGRRSSFNRRSTSRNSENSDTSFESVDTEDDDGMLADWNLPPPKQLSPVKENSTPFDTNQATGRLLPYPNGNSLVKYPKMPRSASISRDAEVIPAPRAAKRYENRMNPAADATSRGRPSEQEVSQIPIFLGETSSRSRSSSPASSLLAKRRGDTIADKMETEFRNASQRNLTAEYEGRRPKWRIVQEVITTDEGGERKQPVNTDMSRTPPNPGKEKERPESPRGHNITPSRRGADLFLSVD